MDGEMLGNLTNYDFFGVLYLINKSKSYFYGRTRLQKMVMLGKLENQFPFSFDFVRHHYGPFSFELYNLIENLVRGGLLEEYSVIDDKGKNHRYRLTKSGLQFLNHLDKDIRKNEKEKLDLLWIDNRFLNTNRLIQHAKEIYGW